MNTNIFSVIVGTGSYIPTRKIDNDDFLQNKFYNADGSKIDKDNHEIINKLKEITGITERRYVTDDLLTSDIAHKAAENALQSSGIDKESLDYIIVAHNFGDVRTDNRRSEFVPSLASRVKHKLAIANPYTVAYDLPFGCPGWLQGIIQADYYIRSGDAKRVMVIGAETLSRIADPHDRDSMIYADGAGATILDGKKSSTPIGILAHATRSDTLAEAFMLWMDKSNDPNHKGNDLFLKMDGHKLYEYAIKTVPQVVKDALTKAGLALRNVSKVLMHQANAKLDEAILKRLYKLYDEKNVPDNIMPMTIYRLGNSSVATLPTMLDFLRQGILNGYKWKSNDILVFASVGAGMNINAVIYRTP